MQPEDIEASRQQLLAATDFDIYSSPKFVEHLVCRLCDLKQTAKQHPYDGIHKEKGYKVEIKHSVVCRYTPPVKQIDGRVVIARTHSFFAFTALQGTHRRDKEADVFVLVGSTDINLRFFVLSANDLKRKGGVGSRNRIDIFIDERRYKNTGKWLKYEVTVEELSSVVMQMGVSQMERQVRTKAK